MLTANMQLPMSIHLLDLFGTAVFALTGALRALTKQLDLMGAVVLAIVTALGGGMMRDALLGRHPPAAFVDEVYLLIAIFTGIAAFFWGRQIREQESWLIIFDAIGLGVFTLVGAWIADQAGLGVTGIIFIAMLTATGGGVLRAMLVAEIPFMLKKEIYASASLIGAASFLLFDYLNFSIGLIIWAVVLITIGIRLISWRYNYNLPK
ncbi:MAG: trimeric intracellular cation channel family protein [Mariprofundus sp.]|nr:trimeric intracellular cation channel family protein [Mariprofundus sp.]